MKIRTILVAAIAFWGGASQVQSATLTVYTDRSAWEAAVGGSFSLQNFNTFTTPSSYESSPVSLGGFSVSVAGETFGSVWHNVGPSSSGNDVNGSPQINAATGSTGGTTLAFDSAISAFGADWNGISDNRVTSINVNGVDVAIPALLGGFWGFVSDTPFASTLLSLTSGPADGFGIDNVVYAGQSTAVPEPGTLAIMALGLVGLGVTRRRRRV